MTTLYFAAHFGMVPKPGDDPGKDSEFFRLQAANRFHESRSNCQQVSAAL